MKLMWFHLMPYTELPEDFNKKHPSVWVDIHSSLFDPRRAHHMYNDFMDELEYAAECGFDADLRERAPFQRLRADALAQPDRRRRWRAAPPTPRSASWATASRSTIRRRAWPKNSR